MMITVAFIYSITSSISKLGIIYSSPTFFAASYFTLLALILSIMLFRKYNLRKILKKELLLIGILYSIMIIFHMMAIKIIFVSYMISIKRTSLLFSIIFGVLIFQEKGLREKIIGGILMILGIMVISFWG
ncbi:MAG: EamA family transporter [Spirochaetota bacterium]|nr:EamA family transporter [Spirochaetota bacterium]